MLDRLKRLERNIRIVIVGTGSMGKGLFYQTLITPGIDCVAVADIEITKAVAAARAFGRPHRIVSDLPSLHQAIRDEVLAVCDDGALLAGCELADAFIESNPAVSCAANPPTEVSSVRRTIV